MKNNAFTCSDDVLAMRLVNMTSTSSQFSLSSKFSKDRLLALQSTVQLMHDTLNEGLHTFLQQRNNRVIICYGVYKNQSSKLSLEQIFYAWQCVECP